MIIKDDTALLREAQNNDISVKPCPFCGGLPVYDYTDHQGDELWKCRDEYCPIHGYRMKKHTWNTRAAFTEPAPVPEIEGLEEAIRIEDEKNPHYFMHEVKMFKEKYDCMPMAKFKEAARAYAALPKQKPVDVDSLYRQTCYCDGDNHPCIQCALDEGHNSAIDDIAARFTLTEKVK